MRPVILERDVDCQSSPDALWVGFADTERLNRHIGASPLAIEERDGGELGRFAMTTWIGPTKVTYVEDPYHWQQGRFFAFKRTMENGLVAEIRVRYDLTPKDDGTTRVHARFEVTPRFAFARPIVWFFSRQSINRVAAYIRATDAALADGSDVQLDRSSCDSQVLAQALEPIAERHERSLVDALRRFLESGSDLEMLRIRPYELADRWQTPRRDTLRLFLDAARSGALSLRWAILCPSCRTGSDVLPSLSELTEEGHCHACDLRFGLDLDQAVEAVFSPHERIRRVDDRPFCIGGPMLTPHVVTQAPVLAGTTVDLEAPPEAGRYRLFARGGATCVLDVDADAPNRAEAALRGDSLEPAQLAVAPGGALRIQGDDVSRHVKIERRDWSFPAATAHQISLLPEFREHFGKEALRPELALSVGRVAILFSDLCGSTALYSEVGDPTAFGVVTDCLRFGTEITERFRGTVVKTMGDAVMAAFASPDDAMTAAAAMLEEWEELTTRVPNVRELDLKIGVAVGTTMVVSANGVLDYFGQTVNTAARVQHLAGPRELVVPAALWSEAAPAGLNEIERFQTKVKGIDQPLDLVRAGPVAPRSLRRPSRPASSGAASSEPASSKPEKGNSNP